MRLFRRLAAADCPHEDCGGGVELYSTKDEVPASDPALPVLRRSRGQAVRWAGGGSALEDYLRYVTAGRPYADYPFED